jgi:hypothetical protein
LVGERYVVAATGGGSSNPIVFSIDLSSTSGACSISGATVRFIGAGSCVIDATQSAGEGYSAGAASQQVVILPGASLRIITRTTAASLGRVPVRLHCSGATCSASLALDELVTVPLAGHKLKRELVELGSVRFRVAKGHSRTVSIVLGGKGLALLAGGSTGRVRLVLVLRIGHLSVRQAVLVAYQGRARP